MTVSVSVCLTSLAFFSSPTKVMAMVPEALLGTKLRALILVTLSSVTASQTLFAPGVQL
ncbi:hypothetical protein D3C86_2186090 [compost metagenome]